MKDAKEVIKNVTLRKCKRSLTWSSRPSEDMGPEKPRFESFERGGASTKFAHPSPHVRPCTCWYNNLSFTTHHAVSSVHLL